MKDGRRIPVFIKGSKRLVGTVVAPINSPGPRLETAEAEGVTATYWRYHERQVAYVEFETLAFAMRWPSFKAIQPRENQRETTNETP